MVSIVAPVDYERYAVLVSPARIPVAPQAAEGETTRRVESLEQYAAGRDALSSPANNSPNNSPLHGSPFTGPNSDRADAAETAPPLLPFDAGLPVSVLFGRRTAAVNAGAAAAVYGRHDNATGTRVHVSG